MVYGFVKQTGGHIDIDSKPGQGTTVSMYFPQAETGADRPDTQSADKSADGAAQVNTGARILIVEDDPDVRAVPGWLLRRQGFDVVEAGDGIEAIQLMRGAEPFDLLFTDIVLPGNLNGTAVADAALEINPDLKVLYTSGYADLSELTNPKDGQPLELLRKPYSATELTSKINEMLSD